LIWQSAGYAQEEVRQKLKSASRELEADTDELDNPRFRLGPNLGLIHAGSQLNQMKARILDLKHAQIRDDEIHASLPGERQRAFPQYL
jgi:hypothetical protein